MLTIGRWNKRRRFVEALALRIINIRGAVKHWQQGGCESLRPLNSSDWFVVTIKTNNKNHPNDFREALQGSWSELLHQVLHIWLQHHFLGKSRPLPLGLLLLLLLLRHTDESGVATVAKPRRARFCFVFNCHRLQPEGRMISSSPRRGIAVHLPLADSH